MSSKLKILFLLRQFFSVLWLCFFCSRLISLIRFIAFSRFSAGFFPNWFSSKSASCCNHISERHAFANVPFFAVMAFSSLLAIGVSGSNLARYRNYSFGQLFFLSVVYSNYYLEKVRFFFDYFGVKNGFGIMFFLVRFGLICFVGDVLPLLVCWSLFLSLVCPVILCQLLMLSFSKTTLQHLIFCMANNFLRLFFGDFVFVRSTKKLLCCCSWYSWVNRIGWIMFWACEFPSFCFCSIFKSSC